MSRRDVLRADFFLSAAIDPNLRLPSLKSLEE